MVAGGVYAPLLSQSFKSNYERRNFHGNLFLQRDLRSGKTVRQSVLLRESEIRPAVSQEEGTEGFRRKTSPQHIAALMSR